MAGPAIRAWQIADALSADHEVVLATTSPTCERESPSFRTESCGPERFAELERWCSLVVYQGYVLNHVPALRRTDKITVVDLYDPIHLEALELNRFQPEAERATNLASPIRVLDEQIRRGDFFVCASEKQRDLWMGFLSAAGRVNGHTYDDDPSLRRLIDVVAFGLPPEPPQHRKAAIKGVVPGISRDDRVILWGGGVYDWFDPITAIRAVDQVRRSRPDVRLFFLGVRHPNPAIEDSRNLIAARRLAAELGLAGTHVFFNDGWVPYEERASFLLEADVAISLHVEHVEAAYSFRTRILDYLWAQLPIVATRGDTFADLIEREGLGAAVAGEDVDAVARALLDLLGDDEGRPGRRARAAGVAGRFVWSEVLQPLVRFCADPRRAPDHPVPPAELDLPAPIDPQAAPPLPRPIRLAARASAAYQRGGVKGLAGAARRRLRA